MMGMDGVRERDEEREKRGETTLRERGWRVGIRERGNMLCNICASQRRSPGACVLCVNRFSQCCLQLHSKPPLLHSIPASGIFVMPAEFYLKRFSKTSRYLQEYTRTNTHAQTHTRTCTHTHTQTTPLTE